MDRRESGTQPFSMLQGHRWPIVCDVLLLLLVLTATLVFGRVADVEGWNATRYLAATSSLAEDGDLDLRNDVLRSALPARQVVQLADPEPSKQAPVTSLSLGPSLLWLPAYLLARPITSDSVPPLERWDPLQRIALNVLSIALLLIVVRFLAQLMRRLGTSDHAAVGGAAALLLGTPLLIYGTSAYTESHLAAVTASCLLLLSLLALERNASPLSAIASGVAIGCVFLCRWQDVTLALLLLAPMLTLSKRLGTRRALTLAATSLTVAAIPITAQLLLWLRQEGSLFPSIATATDGSLLDLLFSTRAGVLFWAPLLLIATVGLLLPWRCALREHWRWALLLAIALQVALSVTVGDGWGDQAYGPRRLTSLLPLLAVGVANLLTGRRARPLVIASLLACSTWGLATANLYRQGVFDLAPVLFEAPARLVVAAPDQPPGLDWFALEGSGAPEETERFGAAATAAALAALLALLLTALRHPPRRLPLSLAGTLLLLLTVGPGTAALRAASQDSEWTSALRDPSSTRSGADARSLAPARARLDDSHRLIRAWKHLESGDSLRARALLGSLPAYPAVHELRATLPALAPTRHGPARMTAQPTR